MSTSTRAVIVDDTDSSIQYSGPWFADTGSRDTAGNFGPAFRSTLHGTQSNASFTFTFTGSRVSVIGSNNPRNDSGVIDPSWQCIIDNISIPLPTPFQFAENNWVFCQKDLVDGPHVLTVKATVLKSQTFWFDNIQYAPSASVSLNQAAVVVDSLDPQLKYGDGWTALGGSANMTGTQNSIFAFDFVGVSLAWYGFIPTEWPHNATTAHYTIDGGSPSTFLLKGLPSPGGVTIYNQKFFETPTLSPGSHSLTVVYDGNPLFTPLTLDYLIVQNGTNSSPDTTSGTPASGTPSKQSNKSSNIGAIAGGIVGGVVLIALTVLAYIYFRRQEKKLNHGSDNKESGDAVIRPFEYSAVPVSVSSSGHAPQLSSGGYTTTTATNPSFMYSNATHNQNPSFSTSADLRSHVPSSSPIPSKAAQAHAPQRSQPSTPSDGDLPPEYSPG